MSLDHFDEAVAVVFGLGDHHGLALVQWADFLFGEEVQHHLNAGEGRFKIVSNR